MLEERTSRILEAAIQSYIETGEPVSSGWLFDHYDFGIKPAMIRLELDTLEDAGYLEKPHHSAGRVPTNSGYEYFVKRLLETKVIQAHERKAPAKEIAHHGPTLHELFEERAWPDLLEKLSAELGLLSVVADLTRDMVYKAGLENLVYNLNLEDREQLLSVIRDFEGVDARLPYAAEKMREGPNVFIGRKSPVTKSDELSVIGGNYKIGDATISIFAIGPKRMDYKKTIKFFRNL